MICKICDHYRVPQSFCYDFDCEIWLSFLHKGYSMRPTYEVIEKELKELKSGLKEILDRPHSITETPIDVCREIQELLEKVNKK